MGVHRHLLRWGRKALGDFLEVLVLLAQMGLVFWVLLVVQVVSALLDHKVCRDFRE